MKKIFVLFAMALAFSSCKNAAKEEAVKQAAIKAVKDSMRLDSFRMVEVAQKEEAAKIAEDKRILMLSEARAAENAPAATMATPRTTSTSSSTTTTTTKKKGRGAIIGGVAGAGAGYLIGRGQDKKTGRAN